MRVIEWGDAVYGTMRCAREDNFNGCVEVSTVFLDTAGKGRKFAMKPKCLIFIKEPNQQEEQYWSSTSYEDILAQLYGPTSPLQLTKALNNLDRNKNITIC